METIDGNLRTEWRRYRSVTSVQTRGRTIGEVDVVNFAGVTGDFASIHVDETFAAKTQYRGRIAHGLLTLCVVTALVAAARPFPGLASYGYDGIRFPAVVRFGDTVRATVRFGELSVRDDGMVTVECHYEARNQRDEVVLVANHVILAREVVIRELVGAT